MLCVDVSSQQRAWQRRRKLFGTSAFGGCKRRRGAEHRQRPSQTSSRPSSPSAPDGSAARHTARKPPVRGVSFGTRGRRRGDSVVTSDLLWGRAGLTVIQAVQQVKSSHSDLEAVRRHEEAGRGVQNETAERSLLSVVHSAAAKQQQQQQHVAR